MGVKVRLAVEANADDTNVKHGVTSHVLFVELEQERLMRAQHNYRSGRTLQALQVLKTRICSERQNSPFRR